ncbi:hypothetical protein [Streptomyces lavendofoliae]|uniref:Uncharacterized protein n=1 Tax=Streptomyces lavendofoliae TaxID=67314 RepID=A0A918M7Y1_9ACTN|nr:hypothetical protein [Streptomyces lavendofoliae]GGU62643.1 hypothetical protein GCM10010274_59310 [Streptomyces lavendofoliae]
MPTFLIPLLLIGTIYALACTIGGGAQPDAPLWLRWPHILWDRLLSGPRPKPAPPRPDYAKITRLERELGLTDEQPLRRERVCLTKDCDGGTAIRTWGGQLAYRIHDH